jgi:hypothetical protein
MDDLSTRSMDKTTARRTRLHPTPHTDATIESYRTRCTD